jgi:hypothetical protein
MDSDCDRNSIICFQNRNEIASPERVNKNWTLQEQDYGILSPVYLAEIPDDRILEYTTQNQQIPNKELQ